MFCHKSFSFKVIGIEAVYIPAVIYRLSCGELWGKALLKQPRITASKGTNFNLFSPLRVYFFDSSTPEMFAEEFEKEFGADAARGELERMVSDIDGKVAKLRKKSPANRNERAENMREIARLNGEREAALKALERYGIREDATQEKVQEERPTFSNEEEAVRWVIENSEDVGEVLGTYESVKGLQGDVSASLPRWQQELQGRRINPESFYLHGDRNLVTPALRFGWLSRDGEWIDTLARELSEFGVEVTPQDVVDFMLEHPSGKIRQRNSDELDELGRKFSELATKAAGVKIGKPDSPTGKLFIENMRTSNNMEQLRSRIEDAQRGEEEALRSMAEQRDAERGSETERRAARRLSAKEAESVLKQMQENAELAPDVELTPENWLSEFGEDGMIDTPLGKVKMGDGQYLKMSQQGRNGKLGMVKPTLTNPDVIIEDASSANDRDSERESSYVFVKSFVDESGERGYLFASVTIKMDGNEVVVSNQEKKPGRIKRLLKEGKLTYIKKATLPSESSTSAQGDQLTKPTGVSSENKDSEEIPETQEVEEESGTPLFREGAEGEEEREIIARAKADGSYMKAPNGKPTKLNEKQWAQVRTKAFKDWFGDWENEPENASKVVDENGEPLVAYHGTDARFTRFDPNEMRDREGSFFFAENPEDAESYSDGTVMPVFINVRNPFDYENGSKTLPDAYKERWIKTANKREQVEILKELGYDGWTGDFENGKGWGEISAFLPTQIKSATDNVGTFDAGNADIRYRFIGEQGAANLDRAEEATTRLDNLGVAREMEKSGKDAKAIKLATGWERGADGKWRYETDDALGDVQLKTQEELMEEFMRISRERTDAQRKWQSFYDNSISLRLKTSKKNSPGQNELIRQRRANAQKIERELFANLRRLDDKLDELRKRIDDGIQNVPLGDVLGEGHPLFSEYPEMKDVKVSFYPSGRYFVSRGSNGFYDHENRSMFVNSAMTKESMRSTLAHELQHAIQYIEGFARGGNTGMFVVENMERIKELQTLKAEIEKEIERGDTDREEELQEIEMELFDLTEDSPVRKYRSLSGEVESRNVQSRLNMTPEERRNSLASETEDVTREDQIFLNDALGASASMDSSVEEVNRKFNEELEQQIKGELPKGHVYQLGKPSSALQSAGVADLNIEMPSSRLQEKSNKDYKSNHPFDLSDVKNLPEAVQSPIAVFESETDPRRTVVLTELKSEGKNFIAVLGLTRMKGRKALEVNSVISLYPKDSASRIGKWFDSEKYFGKNLLKWVDKEKALRWLSNNSSDVNSVGLSSKRIANVIENHENPTLEDGKIVSAVESLSGDLNVPVRIVRNVDEIEDKNADMQRKKRGSKGWYDPKTGEVVVVLPNAKDAADAQATVLHEVVGHKGIRGLFGDRIGEFTKRVLDSMPAEERGKWVDRYGGNGQLAAEEYVAQFAEGYENPGMWEKIKAIFRDLLRGMGIDLKLSDADLKYTLWRGVRSMQQDGTIVGTAEYVAKDRAVQRALFREADADEEFADKHMSLGERSRVILQDRMLSVKMLLDEVRKRGGKVTDYANPYVAENLATSKSKAQIEDALFCLKQRDVPKQKFLTMLDYQGFSLLCFF